MTYVCAVDVGTKSARAGIFDLTRSLIARAEHPIVMNRPLADHAEHDSEDIWAAVCSATRSAISTAAIAPHQVSGISFDATCSLVVRGASGEQISISSTGETRWDTVVWLDHRALAEAEECTATGHRVLAHLGGVMSPEMQTPKLMWLKRHLPESWSRIGLLFDLSDFLTWKASGSLARSVCTLTCKWAYLSHEKNGWQPDFLEQTGLSDVIDRGGLPMQATAIGTDLGPLTPQSAEALGLSVNCRVGTGLIDAYAGALGVLGGFAGDLATLDRQVALVAGTSSCIMALSTRPLTFDGSWGPYHGVALPDCWLSEGGQSVTGALLDHVISWFGDVGEPTAALHNRIVDRVLQLQASEGPDLANRLHVLPDFHGNRSPLSDPRAVGVISGLTIDRSFDSLCRLYWRTSVGIALGVRHILDALDRKGLVVERLHVTGGHAKNELLMGLYADATGRTVVASTSRETTLLGTAMAAATASGRYRNLTEACLSMRQPVHHRAPDPSARARFDRDYAIFLAMHDQRRELDRLIGETERVPRPS